MTLEQHVEKYLKDRYVDRWVQTRDKTSSFWVEDVDISDLFWAQEGDTPTFLLCGLRQSRMVKVEEQMPEPMEKP